MIDTVLKQTRLLNLFNTYLEDAGDWREARDSFLKDFEEVLEEGHGVSFNILVFDHSSTATKKFLQRICDKL